jgi:hypothetical protein
MTAYPTQAFGAGCHARLPSGQASQCSVLRQRLTDSLANPCGDIMAAASTTAAAAALPKIQYGVFYGLTSGGLTSGGLTSGGLTSGDLKSASGGLTQTSGGIRPADSERVLLPGPDRRLPGPTAVADSAVAAAGCCCCCCCCCSCCNRWSHPSPCHVVMPGPGPRGPNRVSHLEHFLTQCHKL